MAHVKDVDVAVTHREKVHAFPCAFGPFFYTDKPSQKQVHEELCIFYRVWVTHCQAELKSTLNVY